MSFKLIHDLSEELSITSRTLRYWEEKGLLRSTRDLQSGWRMYDDKEVDKASIIKFLRGFNISLKDIKVILENNDLETIIKVIKKRINKLNDENIEIIREKEILNNLILKLNFMTSFKDESRKIVNIEKILLLQIPCNNIGDNIMENSIKNSEVMKIINLPEMRIAFYNVISSSPEEEALEKVLEWAERENLMGTARIFGFNTTEYNKESEKYGWAASITIPEDIEIPKYMEEKRLPGGLYAVLSSTNEVYDSWNLFTKILDEDKEYTLDSNRPCLEEHILKVKNGKGTWEFYLDLLEPIKKLE